MKKYLLFILTISIVLISAKEITYAQKTGMVNTTIQFNNENRGFYYYVPEDYDNTKSYPMILCLHGMGDNSTNFGSGVFAYWKQFIKDVIFVSPDGGSDRSRDFYTPAGDELIIQASIDYMNETYNIDNDRIILEGFSLGGRSALKYGLKYPDKFMGLMLHTPAVQSVDEAKGKGFLFFNAKKLPIAITHGTEDNGYLNLDNILYKTLIENNGIVIHKLIQDMGHSLPDNMSTIEQLNFIMNPTPNEFEAGIVDFETPQRTFNGEFKPIVRVRNRGSETITSISFTYSNNDNENKEFTWEGSMAPYNFVDIELPSLSLLADDNNNLKAKIEYINGTNLDRIVNNNRAETILYYQAEAVSLPSTFGFEADDITKYWFIESSGHWMTWSVESSMKKSGEFSLFMFNTLLAFRNQGLAEELIAPTFDLTTVENPEITFDVAYNYHFYSAQYIGQDTYITDTLQVLISTDFGKTYKEIYRKFGAELATAKTPIQNPLKIEETIFYPKDNEWRLEVIDLSDYATSKNATFTFRYISGLGGSINIDNFFIGDASVDIEELHTNTSVLEVSPNPISIDALISFELENTTNTEISVYDLIGNKVLSVYSGILNSGLQNMDLNAKTLSSGSYQLVIRTKDNVITKQIVIQK